MSWPTKKLGEIATVDWGNTSITKASYKSEGYLAVSATGPDGFMDSFEHDRPAIILSAIGAKCGKTFWVEGKWTAIKNTITIFSAEENICLTKYLYYFLTPNKWKIVGGGQPFITKGAAESVKIPLPSLAIQKQIVERLDEIIVAQKLNDDLIQKSDELFQSLLHQELNPAGPADAKAMAGKKDWEVKKLGEMFERITESTLPTKQPDQEFNFIGLENIESNTGQIAGLNSMKGKLIKSTKTVFRKNDVLCGKLRPYLNKVWIADTNGICSTDIWVLRAKQDIISPFLLSSILRQQRIVTKSSASMAGANLPRANKNVFDSIKIQIPPLEVQKQIVAKLSAVQEYKTQLLAQKSKLKELFNSALAKSMNK